MPSDKSEKVKFWIVIVLAVVAGVVAYLRFWHNPGAAAPDRSAVLPTRTQPLAAVAAAAAGDRQPGEPTRDRPPDVALPSIERDIFRPRNIPPAAAGRPQKVKPKTSTPAAVAAVPNFKLGGTIVSGKESVAIINDRFLRPGDTIGAFTVVRIEKNKVQLVSGIKHIELKMINNE